MHFKFSNFMYSLETVCLTVFIISMCECGCVFLWNLHFIYIWNIYTWYMHARTHTYTQSISTLWCMNLVVITIYENIMLRVKIVLFKYSYLYENEFSNSHITIRKNFNIHCYMQIINKLYWNVYGKFMKRQES